MTGYQITLADRTDRIDDADAYQQEGPLTTFFATGPRNVINSWSTRLASYRTADIVAIRRIDHTDTPDQAGHLTLAATN